MFLADGRQGLFDWATLASVGLIESATNSDNGFSPINLVCEFLKRRGSQDNKFCLSMYVTTPFSLLERSRGGCCWEN